jgi:hypothetical protein
MSEQTVTITTVALVGIQNILNDLGRGQTPFPGETEQALKQVNDLLDTAGASGLMKGLYRCTSCHHKWTVVDDLNDAKACPTCTQPDIEPYCSGDLSLIDGQALRALSEHERRYPAPEEFGTYSVEVQRTAVRIKEFEIEGAVGPATAELEALIRSPDATFSSDLTAEYEVEGHHFEPAVEIGGHYLWNDPDPETDCSGPVEVTAMAGEEIFCTHLIGGGQVTALVSELAPMSENTSASTVTN